MGIDKTENTVAASRLQWVDAVRGIGISLVVVGHMDMPQKIYCLIYAFHMPLFFIVTGYLYSSSRSAWEIVRAKAKGLMEPYYLFSALMIVLLVAFPGRWASSYLGKRTWEETLWPTLLGTSPVIEPTWFLPCLFVATVAAVFCRKIARQSRLLVAVFTLTLLAWVWSSFEGPVLPFRIHLVPMGLAFLLVGMLGRRATVWERLSWLRLTLLSMLAVFLFVPMAMLHGPRDMNSNQLGCAVVFLSTGILGTAAVFLACRAVEKWQPRLLVPLAYLGRRSLYILVAHGAVAIVSHEVLDHSVLRAGRLDRLATLCILIAVVELVHGAVILFRYAAARLRLLIVQEACNG